MGLDDLPERAETHDIQERAEHQFAIAINSDNCFTIQNNDRRDYGTDYQLEVRDAHSMTNLRVHVQVKGSTKDKNKDESVSISVNRTNLNYLLRQPDSIYVCYHLPSERLLACFAHDVYRNYEHNEQGWDGQKTVTVKLHTSFDTTFRQNLKKRALIFSRSSMQDRLKQLSALPDDYARVVSTATPIIEIPSDTATAVKCLSALHEEGKDEIISENFERFASVLGREDLLLQAYMAEVNLGNKHLPFKEERVRTFIGIMSWMIDQGKHHKGAGLYGLGNAWLALKDLNKARKHFEDALVLLEKEGRNSIAAQASKNLGTVWELQGEWQKAKESYDDAIKFDPDLGEAHMALATWHKRNGTNPETILDHFDSVIMRTGSAVDMTLVQAWRSELFFEMGNIPAAFREINNLIAVDNPPHWLWPFCTRLVSLNSRISPEASKHALRFWRKYIQDIENDLDPHRELFFCYFKLKSEGLELDFDFASFRTLGKKVIELGFEFPAIIWDRIGHWAESDEKWDLAVVEFEKAYEMDKSLFACCYAKALNHMGNFELARTILSQWVIDNPEDPVGWFQYGFSKGRLGDFTGEVEAFSMASELDPDYDTAWFNLGGAYWNLGEREKAIAVWKKAVSKFPNNPLVSQLPPLIF